MFYLRVPDDSVSVLTINSVSVTKPIPLTEFQTQMKNFYESDPLLSLVSTQIYTINNIEVVELVLESKDSLNIKMNQTTFFKNSEMYVFQIRSTIKGHNILKDILTVVLESVRIE